MLLGKQQSDVTRMRCWLEYTVLLLLYRKRRGLKHDDPIYIYSEHRYTFVTLKGFGRILRQKFQMQQQIGDSYFGLFMHVHMYVYIYVSKSVRQSPVV